MQFMVLAYDGTDPQAIDRRLKARADHIALGDKMFKSGNMLLRSGWIDVFYIVGSRKHVITTFCTIGRREYID